MMTKNYINYMTNIAYSNIIYNNVTYNTIF